MKDAHLLAALERALQRYGSSDLPDDPADDAARPKRRRTVRRRTPGWVSVREIEASQSPNTYPRMKARDINVRCRELARADGGPVLETRTAGLRTWVRFAPPPQPPAPPPPGSADVAAEGGAVEVSQVDEAEREGQRSRAHGGGEDEHDGHPEGSDQQSGADRS